jgi:hypothetical protein
LQPPQLHSGDHLQHYAHTSSQLPQSQTKDFPKVR